MGKENEARSAILDSEFRGITSTSSPSALWLVPPQARPRHDPTTPSKAI